MIRHPHTSPPPHRTPGSAMSSDEPKDEASPEELEKRIKGHLLAALHTITHLQLDISLYLLHHGQNSRRDPFGGNDLDQAYTMYEERANDCRRLWMKLRASSEKQGSLMKPAGNSPPSRSPFGLERSSSPLEYQSALDEDEPTETKRDNQVTPMDVDPAEAEPDVPRRVTPVVDLSRLKSKPKVCPAHPGTQLSLILLFAQTSDRPTLRGVFVTPSGPTRCRLAPIPKGVKLSVESTRIPAPEKPFTFEIPRQPIVSGT